MRITKPSQSEITKELIREIDAVIKAFGLDDGDQAAIFLQYGLNALGRLKVDGVPETVGDLLDRLGIATGAG